MLYEKSKEPTLNPELFRNPTNDYRGAPFWSWNCKLEPGVIDEQIEMLYRMGFGGYHIHVRTGLDTPYLGDEFMSMVRRSLEQGKKKKMLTWLYDEDRWPSGSAGGRITKDVKYRARDLRFSPVAEGESAEGALAAYNVELNGDGTLKSYRRVKAGEKANWAAFPETEKPSPWYNGQTYIDTLNPEAVKEFARVTHETYKKAVGDEFGKSIPSIFTDEPEFTKKTTLSFAAEKKSVVIPWTDDFPETYRAAYGEDPLDTLPELFWELPDGKVSVSRYRYHDHVTERFASAFCDTLGSWCGKNGLMLTGHMMEEPTLQSQTAMVGETMRCYRGFGLPGIDMLCDYREYTTAKQAASAVHQQGAPGMLSELYGVTGWDYDFRGHKLQGDWQAALGVTARVLHLTWMSMKGEAKRDYPASIGYQSPWWDQYSAVEDHFARLNTALTRGKPQVRVAVVHPIESYWLHWGPREQTAAIREQMDANFKQLTESLLLGLIDFDFLCESRLPDLCKKASAPLRVGEMSYDVVIVPACETLRATTLERLKAFRAAGGRLIFLGACPKYVDALPSDEPKALYDASEHVDFNRVAVLQALEDVRFVDVRRPDGTRSDSLLYQLRRDGDAFWLFLAQGKEPQSPDIDPAEELRITLNGEFAPVLYDTMTGGITPLAAEYRGGKTILTRRMYLHDSLLLRLTPGRAQPEAKPQAGFRPDTEPELFLEKVPVTLEEPNAFVLDLAEYALDGEPLRPLEELLRADNEARGRLGYPPRGAAVVQPYLLPQETPKHSMHLRFTIPSEIMVEHPLLALEDAERTKIIWNGMQIASATTGWYVDKAIRTVALPPIRQGENVLELVCPFGRRTNLEWCYLLGDFGVRVAGVRKTVVEPVRELAFGDIVPQGLPFYTGNCVYHLKAVFGKGAVLRVPQYRGALLRVAVDGHDVGSVIYSPYAIRLPDLAPGGHNIDIKLYNTRQNGFGQLHHTRSVPFYQGPDSWRTTGDLWSYEYQLFQVGILKSPELYKG